MKYGKSIFLSAIVTTVLSGCGLEAPKCSNDRTISMVKKIITDKISFNKETTEDKKFSTVNLDFIRASSYEKEIKKYTCEAKIIVGGVYEQEIKFDSQLNDTDEHIVSVSGISPTEFLQLQNAAITAIQENTKDSEKNGKSPIESVPKQEASVVVAVSSNQISSALPKFSDYPIEEVYTGAAAALVIDKDYLRDYETQFSAELSQPPSFAGEFIGVQWGCGAECVSQYLVSKRTGKILEQGFGGECGDTVEEMHVDSRLIVTSGPECDDEFKKMGYKRKYYVLNGVKFNLVHEVSIPDPAVQ